MNIILRQLVSAIIFTIILFVLFSFMYFIAFPLESWSSLWENKILDFPFVYIVPSISILLGACYGALTGYYWKKQLYTVETAVKELEKGRPIPIEQQVLPEIHDIWVRIEKIQKNMLEQTKLSQKLANEKAEDHEKRVQEMVSQERNRLARELHDSVSQQLFAASMMMSAITESKPLSDDRETKQLKLIEETIQQSQLEMRALLLHLRPAALKGKTLQEGVEELLVELMQKVSMKIKWKVEHMQLDKGVEEHLFRILQESVSNTLRHAKATTLDVLLIKRDDFVIMRVSDDGVGFEVDNEGKTGSYGMQNMYERAIEIGGTIKVVSLKNKGTRLEVKVPVLNVEGEAND
ncbi:sensor histidine kinase [Metabacillus niabensis]|uniref:Sensor histidine kinase n=1 Tax=Metabacillus niabensis TaxID=324854 RepID=A0ABT9Z323_9BACI|nr:sensor histidine kinase [Metabacillus niabensis]MDQ0226661.1 NarL family two-component system sensor histidine kinase LiaS [Metabacillus niabensis]